MKLAFDDDDDDLGDRYDDKPDRQVTLDALQHSTNRTANMG